MKIAICEDHPDELEVLLQCFRQYEQEHHQNFEITTFKDGLDLVNNYTTNFDALYLDIQMPLLNGMEAAKRIRQIDSEVPIIFLTNYVQYAIDGYAVNATDFILKPITYFNFSERFKKIARHFAKSQQNITLKTNQGFRKINLENLYYIESQGHYLHYYLLGSAEQCEELIVNDSMKNTESQLASYNFARCNNGYLVNLKHVLSVEGNFVKVGPFELQISRPRKKKFMQAITDYLGMEG